jgi:hypothetical protein
VTVLADPNDVADYALDFVNALAVSETIASITSVTVPAALTLSPSGQPAPALSGTRGVSWLTGGVAGVFYDISCRITTSGGRTYDRRERLCMNDL